MQATEVVSTSNIELEEKKDDDLPVNKEKKKTVRFEKDFNNSVLIQKKKTTCLSSLQFP
jgi:hypothetical protein